MAEEEEEEEEAIPLLLLQYSNGARSQRWKLRRKIQPGVLDWSGAKRRAGNSSIHDGMALSDIEQRGSADVLNIGCCCDDNATGLSNFKGR